MRRAGWDVVVCCASGPSFSAAQAATITIARDREACRVIAANDNWRRVPNSDVLFAMDGKWWQHNHAAVTSSGFAGELWTTDRAMAHKLGLRAIHSLWMDRPGRAGLTSKDNVILSGGNSGHGVVNLAYLFGARRIVLVGYDMQASASGELHWFGRHANPLLDRNCGFAAWIARFRDLARDLEVAGVELINSTERTALDFIPRATLERALQPMGA